MNRASSTLFVLGLTTLLTTQAFAQAVVEKDWIQDKKIHELTGISSCVASTAIAQSTLSIKAEIILPENDEKIPLIVLKAKGLKGLIPRAHVRPDAKTQYPMLLLKSDVATDEDTFVLSPMRMPEVLDIIAAKNTLDVYFGEGATAILARISLKGSSKTITRTANCRVPKVLWKDRLFKDLKSDPQLATPSNGSVKDLLASFQKTLDLINLSEKTQVALASQIKVSQSVVAAEKQAAQVLANSEKSVLDTQNQISSLQRKIADLRSAINKAQIDLPQLQAERPKASQDLTKAQNALRNVETEVRRLQGEIDIVQNREDQIASNLDSIQSQVSSLEYQLSQQQSLENSLRQDQNSRYSQLNSLQSLKTQLEQNYNSFDVNRRIEKILRNNSTYMSQYNSLPGLNSRRDQLNNEIPAASDLVKELTRAVKDCQAGPGILTPGGVVSPACDAEKARLDTAQRDLNNKQNDLNNVNRQINDTNVSISNYQAQARQQAINERDRIETDLINTNQNINQIQLDINAVDGQINNLVQIDIPESQNELYSKKSDLSITQNSLAQAQSNTRYAQANLVNYKNAVGYDRLATNVTNAQSRLTSIDQRISQAQSTLSKGPGQIAAHEAEVKNQQNLLGQRQAAVVQAKANLSNAQTNTSSQQVIEQDIRNQLSIQLGDLLKAKRSTQGLSKALYGF